MSTPILSLPNELTAEIFLHCLSSSQDPPCSRTAPLLLASICRRWRLLALCTPELWSSLRTPFKGSLPHGFSIPVDPLLELWLQRARNRHITLSVTGIPAQSLRFPTIAHLSVSCEQSGPPAEFAATSFPALQSLVLGDGNIQTWLTVPGVRNLFCENLCPFSILTRIILRSGCTSLTTLRIRVAGGSKAVINLLRATPSVTSLQLHQWHNRFSDGRTQGLPSAIYALEDASVVPRLSELEIAMSIHPGACAMLLNVRSQRRDLLHKVDLTFQSHLQTYGPFIDSAARLRLREMEESGLDLTLSCC